MTISLLHSETSIGYLTISDQLQTVFPNASYSYRSGTLLPCWQLLKLLQLARVPEFDQAAVSRETTHKAQFRPTRFLMRHQLLGTVCHLHCINSLTLQCLSGGWNPNCFRRHFITSILNYATLIFLFLFPVLCFITSSFYISCVFY